MLFAAFLVSQGLPWQTIKSYLVAVCNLDIWTGLPGQDKSLSRLQLMLCGICVWAATWDRQMIWAAMNLCFFGTVQSVDPLMPHISWNGEVAKLGLPCLHVTAT